MKKKRERESTATMETEMVALNNTILNYKRETEIKTETEMSLRQQTHEYETPSVFFYLLSVQFISQYESIISII